MKLYGYWRSGAAWRVRIALHLKGVPFETVPVHLVRDGGQHKAPAYVALNPQQRVPTLVLDDGTALVQSPAILEWLDEVYPSPPLLPTDPLSRAKIRGLAAIISCDVHPLINAAGVLPYLKREMKADEAAIAAWVAHWNRAGLQAVEAMIEGGDFCFGASPTLADLYLVPQIAAARRFKVPLDDLPKIARVVAHCAALEAFKRAAPDAQIDAE
jgi:maleylpyruvate isomerase